MSNDLAYAMLLIHQRQARDLRQQHLLLQLFQTYVDGGLTAEQYEQDLRAYGRTNDPAATSSRSSPSPLSAVPVGSFR
jgi:hypothetical protein